MPESIVTLPEIDLRKNQLLEGIREVIKIDVRSSLDENGFVHSYSDGVAKITGLREAAIGQPVSFIGAERKEVARGFVHDLEETFVNCLVITDSRSGFFNITPGIEVRLIENRAGFNVVVGDELLSSLQHNPLVVSPAGTDFWTSEPIDTSSTRAIERTQAPTILERTAITREDKLNTGIATVDSRFAIHPGQRMLVLGDKESGKGTFVLEMLRNIARNHPEILFVYAAISKEASQIRHLQNSLKFDGQDRNRCVIVATKSDDPASLHFVAPFAATAIGEFWAEQGQKVIIVYDDLTQHAASYRQISLLLRHFPGREAYPGDLFYLHSRLLERCAKLKTGGSLTGIPIIETVQGDFTGYLPTNAISITDGQILLSSEKRYGSDNPDDWNSWIDKEHSVSRI